MIAANNLCLKNVGVSFYYVARSLSTVFNIAMAYVALGQKTSARAVSCCALVVFGFWLGVDQGGNSIALLKSQQAFQQTFQQSF